MEKQIVEYASGNEMAAKAIKQIGYDLDNRLDPTGKNMTVRELVNKYVATKRGVKNTTRAGYRTVQKFLEKEPFVKPVAVIQGISKNLKICERLH